MWIINERTNCGTAEPPVVTMWTQFMGTLQHHNINYWDNIDLGSIVSVSRCLQPVVPTDHAGADGVKSCVFAVGSTMDLHSSRVTVRTIHSPVTNEITTDGDKVQCHRTMCYSHGSHLQDLYQAPRLC